MSFLEKLGTFINGNDEKAMIEKEHRKIRHLVEEADREGFSMCYYSYKRKDGWVWEKKDFLELRLWLNSLGLFSLEDEEGVYILWAEDENMKSLIRQQNRTLRAIYQKECEKYGF